MVHKGDETLSDSDPALIFLLLNDARLTAKQHIPICSLNLRSTAFLGTNTQSITPQRMFLAYVTESLTNN